MAKQLRVLFLDIDGVLNTAESRHHYGLDYVNPVTGVMLNTFLTEQDVRVVVSSSWRFTDRWPSLVF